MLFSLCSAGFYDDPDELVAVGFVGRDNSIDLLLTERQGPANVNQNQPGLLKVLPVAHIQRVVFELAGYTLDSQINADYFDLTQKDDRDREKLVIYLGRAISEPCEGLARLTLYDEGNQDGILWIDRDPATPPTLRVKMLDYEA